MPPNMLNADSKPTLPIAQFKRHIQQPGQDSACGDSEGERDRVPVRLKKRRVSDQCVASRSLAMKPHTVLGLVSRSQ